MTFGRPDGRQGAEPPSRHTVLGYEEPGRGIHQRMYGRKLLGQLRDFEMTEARRGRQ